MKASHNIAPSPKSFHPPQDVTPLKVCAENSRGTAYSGEEETETPAQKSRQSARLRFAVLALVSFLGASVVITSEQPLPLQSDIIRDLQISHTKYTFLLAAYTFPNIVFPLLGGWIFDSLGRGLCLILFAVSVLIGQLFVVTGAAWKHYNLILIGRLVTALGGENLNVTISGYLYYWYGGKKLGMPMAMVTIAGLMASASCYLLTPVLYNINRELAFPMWCAFVFCAIAVGCALLVRSLTIYGERHGMVNVQEIAQPRDSYDPTRYRPVFWFITGTAFFTYGTVFSALGVASGFIQEKYGFTNVSAGFLLSIPQMSVLLFFPLFGMLVDRGGMLSAKFMAASFVLAGSVLYMAGSSPCDKCYWVLPGTFMFGLAYALYVPTLWASPSLVVSKTSIGLAYGFISAVRNLGVSLTTIATGIIRDQSHNYSSSMWFLAFVAILGLFASIAMTVYDCTHGRLLHDAAPAATNDSDPERESRKEDDMEQGQAGR